MIEITVQVEGMACSMCEAHVNDTVRRAFPVKKVSSNRGKCQTLIICEEDIDTAALKEAIEKTGYTTGSVTKRPYEKKGVFSFLKK